MDKLLRIVIEDVPIKYQTRLLEILNPICSRCINRHNISFCIAESDYKVEFVDDIIIKCSGFNEER